MPYDKSGNYIPTGWNSGGINNFGFTGDKDPGDVGTGVWNGQLYRPNAQSFGNPDDAQNKSLLGQYYNMLGGRTAPTATAANAGNASLSSDPYLANAATYGGATINKADSDAARAYQNQLLMQLQGEANGTAPSIAEAQMKQGLQQNLQQQASLAGSLGGGGNPALAMRNLQYGAAAQNQQLLGQAGIARLQEQQMAQQQLGNVAGAMRGQDIGLAAQQAGLTQQAQMANMQAQNQFSLANAGFEQQNNLANAQMKNQFALQNAGWEQQANLANQQAQYGLLGLNQQGQTWALGQNLGLSEADRQAAMQYEQLMAQQSTNQMQMQERSFEAAGAQRGKLVGGLLSGLGGMMAMSDARQKKDVRYEGLTLSPVDEKTDIADESSASRTNMGDDDTFGRLQVGMGNFFQGLGSGLAGTTPQFAKYNEPKKPGALPVFDSSDPEGAAAAHGHSTFAEHMANMRQQNAATMAPAPAAAPDASGGSSSGTGMMLGAFGGGDTSANVLSDEHEKTDKKKGASGQLLDPLTPYSYMYKDPTMPGAAPGRQLGIMAQDLERSPYAAQAVVDTPQGKMVDYGKLAPPMLAAEADLHKRLSVVEGMLGDPKAKKKKK